MKANTKTAIRLLKKHIIRFFTIIAIVLVSIGFVSGVGEVTNKISVATKHFYAEQNVSDIYIKSKSQFGFSQQQIEQIENMFGKENTSKSMCFEQIINDKITRIYIYDLTNAHINKLVLKNGNMPLVENEVVCERKTTAIQQYEIGDKISLMGKEYIVSGQVLNPLIINNVEEPSFAFEDKHIQNVIYINSTTLPMANDIYVTLHNRADFAPFGDEYKKQIEQTKQQIYALLGEESVSVLSLYENFGMFTLSSYSEKVGLIGIIFVIFFMLVTLLVVYSTMSRLLDEERSQIACQKTLGYNNSSILGKYVLFVFVATLIGGIVAFAIGFALTYLLYVAFNAQYAMPPFPTELNFIYYLSTFALMTVATTLLTYFTGRKIINKKPVVLLTPKSPKSGKKVFVEKIPFVWNKLSFKYKSTCRNVLLFKSRFFMTVISVIGSTVLVLAGLGLLDCSGQIDGGISIVMVSFAVVAFSAVLCSLVIYNLANINVSERNREIATLMVLGYNQKEVTGYIFREIYIMCFIGAIFGLPVGALFLDFVFGIIDFGAVADLNWWTWLIAPALTMFFGFLSTRLLYKKITKTDMNASLKILE